MFPKHRSALSLTCLKHSMASDARKITTKLLNKITQMIQVFSPESFPALSSLPVTRTSHQLPDHVTYFDNPLPHLILIFTPTFSIQQNLTPSQPTELQHHLLYESFSHTIHLSPKHKPLGADSCKTLIILPSAMAWTGTKRFTW